MLTRLFFAAVVAIAVLGALAAVALLNTVQAQSLCGPHEEIVAKLSKGFKESRAGLGLAGNGGLVELFVSETGGWSVLFTRPDGVTCLVAAGQSWEIVEPRYLKPTEEDS